VKALFFHATSGVAHPKVLGAFEAQTRNTLRPFNQFLGQAIHTAKERQFRYQLPWERVRNLLSIRLTPIDSLLRIPRRSPGLVITNWPAGKEPDFAHYAFVTNRGVPVRIEAATQTGQGLLVRANPPILPGDRLLWCSVDCQITPEAAPPPPQKISDPSGKALHVVGTPRPEGERYWLLVVQGLLGDTDLIVDGEEVEAEALPVMDGLRRLVDATGRSLEITAGMLRVEEPPAEGFLRGEDGIRYRWEEVGSAGRRGNWVQLLPPETSDADEFLDPRAAFCEGDVTEVWTAKFRRQSDTYKVKKVDQDRYQLLLDRFPPEGTTLFLPVDLRNLYLQKRALRQLAEAPLPHHQGLMRLCEDPQHARWPGVQPKPPAEWRALTDETRSGTPEQRTFVAKALGSPDFAFLEGPPGSGKTTAICEIVQQLVERGERVLLCASTHVAIDNVLERLLGSKSPIDAVRIGKLDKVDDKVQAVQIDIRIESLVAAWRQKPEMQKFGETELSEMAERTIIMAANLTCGTTMGIVNHPLFRGRDEDLHVAERPITTMPHWDVLIVDEASKTLIQDFMVPALMAKRWIIVGDVRQLPPFADRADIVANLRDLVDERDQPIFPRDHQRARLLLFRLLRPAVRQPGMRWLIVEPPGVLSWLARELEAEPTPELSVVRVVARGGAYDGPIPLVTVAQLRTGEPAALRLAAADWVLVGEDLFGDVADWLPSNLLLMRDLTSGPGALTEGAALVLRQGWWRARAGGLPRPYKERKFKHDDITTLAESQACETDWLRRNDLGQELAWRLTRLHELRHSRNDRERQRLRDDLKRLLPAARDISEPIAEIQDIGLPSIIEVIQEGIGVERSKRPSALTEGLRARREGVFAARFESLSYQHRMHPQIAEFSREIIYHGASLKDANTIESRDATLGWSFGKFCSRRAWAHVRGREHQGENQDEVSIIAAILREFIAWARRKGPPKRDKPTLWEVACLCFYVKQERAMSQMLQTVTQDERKTRFQVRDAPVEVVCGTVDRFQGREADLVMLSMRNTGRVGFLDSPNRLNVAVTRARQQLVVVGNAEYFEDCRISELEELAKRTPKVDEDEVRRWRRSHR
jgi:hypothetical protein